ncbi:MAG: hypothetical protein LKE89_06450 [Lactobacillaceae bacterium]|nr:hypothetical protein [Lactobacillaceae bacterium]
MKNKRLIISGLLVAALAIGLTACGSKQATSNSGKSAQVLNLPAASQLNTIDISTLR